MKRDKHKLCVSGKQCMQLETNVLPVTMVMVIIYSKPSLSRQLWDNSETGGLAKLAAQTNFQDFITDANRCTTKFGLVR